MPDGTSPAEVDERTRAEATAAAALAAQGHLVRLWRRAAIEDDPTVIGLYAAKDQSELNDLLGALPLAAWLQVTIIPLARHSSDPLPAVR